MKTQLRHMATGVCLTCPRRFRSTLSGTQIPATRTQCAVPVMGLRIYSNGNVSFCSCNDYDNDPELSLGSIAETSLLDLSNSEKMWKLWNWDRYGVPTFCRRCTFYKPIEQFRDRLFTNLFIMEA